MPDAEWEPHVAVKPVIAAPLPLPALNDTRRVPLPTLTAFTAVAAAGVPIVTDTPLEAGPAPAPVTAATVNETVEPKANGPCITVVVPGPETRTDEPVLGVTR